MKPSIRSRPARSAAAKRSSTSSGSVVSGFSQSTCLPASSARRVHSTWSEVGGELEALGEVAGACRALLGLGRDRVEARAAAEGGAERRHLQAAGRDPL